MSKAKTPEQTDTMSKVYEERKGDLDKRMAKLLEQEKNILKNDKPWTQEFKRWLELTQKAYRYWKNAKLLEKQKLAKTIFLELEVKNGKLASYKYTEPYQSCKESNSYLHGGQ